MRKLLTFLTTLTAAVAVIVLFTACEQFLKDPEDFLSYWASEAFIKDHSIGAVARPDEAGVPCVSSSPEVHIMLTVHNPKNFPLVMPTSSEPAGIVEFKELSQQPTEGTHYVLGQTASGRLKLTYTKDFLQKYEQGSGSLNPTITLKATDGRVFKKTYTFGIKSNTPPPKPEIVIAKTKGSDPHYVLCLKFNSAEMTRKIGTVPIHKDIAKITINDSHYTLLYKEDNSDFQKPYGDSFVERGNVEKLNPSSPDVPSGAWVLYYKTDIQIGLGNLETSYTVTLRDKGGVTSDKAVATIAASGPTHTVTFSVENPTGGTLTAQVDGMNIASGSAVERGKTVTFTANPAEGWEVEGWTFNGNAANGTSTSASLIVNESKIVTVKFKKTTYKVTFSVDGANGTLKATVEGSEIHSGDDVEKGKTVYFTATPKYGWEVEGWTASAGTLSGGGTGTTATLKVTDNATVTVKFKKKKTVNSSDYNAWKLLKKVVEIADDHATITIDGKIKATSGENAGQIVITKTLTIRGKTGADSDILDANTMSRIFKVENRATLFLENLKLTGGKVEGEEDADKCGGAIYASNAIVNITNCIITGNEAETNGGGIYVEGGTTDITNCIFTGNTAKNGGGIYMTDSSYPTVTISGGTIGGTGPNEANKATGTDGNGGGIYVGYLCTLRLQNDGSTGCKIKGNTAQRGGGVYANYADVSMQDGTRIAVDAVNNDVYLDNTSRIKVFSTLTAEDSVARITVPNTAYNTYTQVLYSDTSGLVSSEHAKFQVTPKGDEYWTVGNTGHLTKDKTAVFNNITKDQIKTAIEAADPSTIYDEGDKIDHMALDGKLVLYMTGKRDYGIMRVTEVNNGGGGYIKFNYKTFRTYESDVLQHSGEVVNGGERFDLDTGGSGAGGNDFFLDNAGQKRFKVLDNAKFYILSN